MSTEQSRTSSGTELLPPIGQQPSAMRWDSFRQEAGGLLIASANFLTRYTLGIHDGLTEQTP